MECLEYMPMVRCLATSISRTLEQPVDYRDLVQYGVLGLLIALRRFNPDKGVLFQTFAWWHIRGAIQDGLRKMKVRPRGKHERRYRSEPYSDTDENMAKTEACTPTIRREEQRIAKIIKQSMKGLTKKQQEVVLAYYYNQLTHKEISHTVGCTIPAIKNRLHAARRTLKKELKKRGINDVP